MSNIIHIFITVTSLAIINGLQQARVLETYKLHLCTRPCIVNRPQNCYYDFYLELYFTLTKACYDCPFNKTDCLRPHCVPADGVPRAIMTVNRMLPGPSIHVCQGDQVIVNVINDLGGGEGTSIHWHGILQHGSQHMDGVSLLTQCPIATKSTFEYRFNAENAGTHFWHAHSSLQRMDGVFGAFVIRQPNEFEPHLGLYEEDLPEHTLIVHDWLNELSISRFAWHQHAGGDNKPRSILINGKGVLQEFFDPLDNTTMYTPVEIFHVTRGQRYRFRTISNGLLNCPIQISVDSHNLTMIASDGSPFQKRDVEFFNIFAGERFDFVLHASLPIANYWIRAIGLADCAVKHAKQIAILRYVGAPDENPTEIFTWNDTYRRGKQLNPWNMKGTEELIPVTELVSLLTNQTALKKVPDKQYYLAMDFNKIDNYLFQDPTYYPLHAVEQTKHVYMPQINHVSLKLPPSPPLSQYADLNEDIFCNHETVMPKNCSEEYCECVFRLHVNVSDVVEIVIIDEGVTFNANHPMHLHGHQFFVVGMDKFGDSTSLEEVKRLDKEGQIKRNLGTAIAKDTVTVPDGGYTILRFHADNPGFWFFHCHIEFHVDIGMGIIIQVGNKEDFPKVPKGFPKCGNWQFSGYSEVNDTLKITPCVNGVSVQKVYLSLIYMTYFVTIIHSFIPMPAL